MRLKWFSEAIDDLIALREFIAQDNPAAAAEVSARILKSVDMLADQPGIGRPGRVEGTKELVIPGTPFIIPYRVKKSEVQLLRVLHSSRKWLEVF
jgi:toxin ParE1/3/4